MGRMDGKVAIITGAARGQGESHARRFVAEGAKVVLGDVLDDLGEKVAVDLGGDDALYVHHDVTSEGEWAGILAAATDTFGKVDVLINNAAVLGIGMIETSSLDAYLSIIRINQVSVFLGMRAVIPAMRAAGGGSIVNVSSAAGLDGVAGMVGYCASKFAVRGMTKVAAIELGSQGIRVNSVHPGGIDTPMIADGGLPLGDHNPYATQALPRVGRPEEVSNLMVFLASDESSYCTGSEFVVDGGMTAGQPLSMPTR